MVFGKVLSQIGYFQLIGSSQSERCAADPVQGPGQRREDAVIYYAVSALPGVAPQAAGWGIAIHESHFVLVMSFVTPSTAPDFIFGVGNDGLDLIGLPATVNTLSHQQRPDQRSNQGTVGRCGPVIG